MKILLVKPHSLSDHIQPPLGLGYLAASVRGNHEIDMVDLLKTPMSDSAFQSMLKGSQYDVVGFQCYTQEIPAVKSLITATRMALPAVKTVAGGPHPTLMPQETMSALGMDLDFILRGEGEIHFGRLLGELEKAAPEYENIPCLGWRKDGEVVINSGEINIEDLNEIPVPAWDLIGPHTYPPAQHGAFFDQFPIAPIVTTRGCPFRCTFCSATLLSGKRVRRRDVQNIMSEIRILHEDFGIREIHIIDDNFSVNKGHAKAVLQGICDLDLGISIAFPNGIKVETVDEELLSLMKKSGVYLISLGIESGSDRLLKMVNKHLTVAQIEEKCRMIHAAGIDIAGFFILGLPTETKAEIKKTIRFALDLPLIRANFFDFLPLPGTDVYYELQRNKELDKVDWNRFSFMTAPYVPEGLTHEEMRNLQRQAFVRFYFLRPRIFLKNILQIKSWKHFGYLLRRFYHWVVM